MMKQTNSQVYIYGTHVIYEAIKYVPQSLEKIIITSPHKDHEIESLARKNTIIVEHLKSNTLPKAIDRALSHQGVIGLLNPEKLMSEYKEFIHGLEVSECTALVLLGEIKDPQNVGAIIRSAAAFGIAGVLIPEHRQSQITGSVVKVSAGMAFKIPLVRIGNVNTYIRDLKEKGFWIYGLDAYAKQSLLEEKFDAPTVFIFGSEEKGIREKTLELCDITLSIPIHPKCESLNVASSASIAFYTWSNKHPEVFGH